jgi:hypothetical protein
MRLHLPEIICVMEIRTNRTKYLGHSIGEAAKALRPGTVCGRGHDRVKAVEEAKIMAAWHRDEEKRT